ncbi:hypothetical protein [Agromyces sp. GXS1127]|uniref:hypothetical protein n=1 Tax=Agromyces sp. GXS1127 TaxID=3424181 RepID=UPI003D3242CC
MKRAVIGCVVALGLVVGGGAGAAFAGEYNGKGEHLKAGAHVANSACAFSGRDLPDGTGEGFENNPFPFMDDDAVTGGHVQSYGQYVRAGLKSEYPSPGVACRGGAEEE